MKHSILYLMTAAVLLAGCAKEVDKTQVPEIPAGMHAVTITASVDNPETRTSVEIVNKKGIYSWQENEQIAVVETQTGNKNGILPFQILDQENGTFTGSMTDGKSLVFAVTPKGALTAVECTDETNLAFTLSLSGTYNFSDGTNAVMVAGLPTYAEGSENPHFTFQHAAALYRVVYENVPVRTKALHFVASEPITGDFRFESLEGVEIVQSESGQDYADVLLDAPVSSPNTTLTFYVPVPTGTYSNVTVSLLDEELNPIANTTRSFEAADYSVTKGQIVRIPKITLAPVVAPAGTILFYEPFTGLTGKPTAPGTGATVYNNATVNYTCENGGTNTQIFNENNAGGESPELLVSKSGGSFTISGIPTGGNTTLTVSWYSNNTNIDLYYGEKVVSRIEGQEAPYQVVLTVPEGKSAINICFKNTKSGNGRLDNIVVTAGAPLLPAGLAFETSEVQAILGEDFVEPALANEHSLSVTYASSNPNIAEVDTEGNVTVKAVGVATITVSSEPTEEYAQGQASYTIHVVEAELTIDEATDPVKAECKEDATVTFGVQSNIEWVPSVEEDVNDIVKSVSVNEENTVVTVTFNKNEDAQNEKTAVIAITPANEVHAALKKTITVTQAKFEFTDILTATLIGKTSYSDWSNLTGTTGAVYAGNSTKNNSGDIQMRASDYSGIVSTASAGYIRKVKVTWGTGNATDGRTLNIYGSNTAFTSAADLYANNVEPVATLNSKAGTIEYEFTSDYEYVGVRSASGALYLADIAFTWEPVDPNAPKFGASIDGDANIAADVTTGTINVTGNVAWTASADNGATVSPSSGTGGGTITVTMPENESYTNPANYVVTVSTQAEVATKTYELTFIQAPAEDPNKKGSANNPYTVSEAITVINALENGASTDEDVYVAGIISEVISYNSSYHSITYNITADGTASNPLQVYSGKGLNSADFSGKSDLSVGDEVVVKGKLKKYIKNGTVVPEFDSGSSIVSLIPCPVFEASVTDNQIAYTGGNITLNVIANVPWVASINNGASLQIGEGTAASSVNGSTTTAVTVIIPQNENGATYTISFTTTATVTVPANITITQSANSGETWTLVETLADDMEDGGTYIIAAKNDNKYYTVPKTTINGQTFTCIEAAYSESDGLTPAAGTGEFVFTAVSGVDNAYYIYNTNLKKYLVATGSKKFGYVDSSSTDYGYWTFSSVTSGGFSGVFSVKHSSKTHYMRAYSNTVKCYDGASNNGVYLFISK